VALLTTTGRRSGRARTTPVEVWSVDDRQLLVAAAGGAAVPPAWWHNLRADPHVSVDGHPAVARPLGTLEQRLAWARLVSAEPRLERVRARAGHDLPIVELRSGSGGPRIPPP
jgi:deazaflavin-dependent oxidoreductase (nitroreductase family)